MAVAEKGPYVTILVKNHTLGRKNMKITSFLSKIRLSVAKIFKFGKKSPDFEARDIRSVLPDPLELRKSAAKLGLEHVSVLFEYPDEVLLEQYNGIGPDRWPSEVRDILSWLLSDVLEAVEIHDMDFHRGGTEAEFHAANDILGENVRKIAVKKYGFWRPRRYFLKKLSWHMAEWSDKYGLEGWNLKEEA